VKVVLCTTPLEAASTLASKLVEERLAACVNVLPKVTSVYRWQGAVEHSEEALLIVKTSDARLAALAARIDALHPYDVPEIVALDVDEANAAYAAWVAEQTEPPHPR
jgi:periplasmic divalent cation tolerance protein